ncbi:iron ABC transporter permease [Rhizobium laguerreae]|uniref:FecCD family ABC transporter permease n=1 Tax=Rhizobium laguerreae TaxID=1076926 RepID=UPI001C916E0D|nr:iron ABC transporter permease [Rhizobium laguerreae]MBY3418558.1 iron ABC transporter permease [Rhizobium laguerreae]
MKSRPLLLLALPIFLILIGLALSLGPRPVAFKELWNALVAPDLNRPEDVVIWSLRMPRLVAALLCGAALGAAGSIMQTVTRNPLADPGLLGISAGAAFGVVIFIAVAGDAITLARSVAAMAGATSGALAVLALGAFAGSRPHPIRLLLAGAAVSAFFLAIVRGFLLLSQQALDTYRFWVMGGLDGISLEAIGTLSPLFAAGLILTVAAGLMLNAYVLGEDLAKSLGVDIRLAYLLGLAAAVCLCSTVVTLAGPIGFVGLIAPHLAMGLVAGDERVRLLVSALLGAAILLTADIAGRLLFAGTGMQAGVMVAVIGAPALVLAIRRGRVGV